MIWVDLQYDDTNNRSPVIACIRAAERSGLGNPEIAETLAAQYTVNSWISPSPLINFL